NFPTKNQLSKIFSTSSLSTSVMRLAPLKLAATLISAVPVPPARNRCADSSLRSRFFDRRSCYYQISASFLLATNEPASRR
ncbi:MAG: hypothetical protein SCK70_02440, partial [bacterium]|nr:hypothetical protein [bacterium]